MTVAADIQTPIKQRILAYLQERADHKGRIAMPAPELARKFGLSLHDLAKNLDQMFKEGVIHDPWAGDRISDRLRVRTAGLNEAALAQPKPADNATIVDKVREYIRTHPGPDGWTQVTIPELTSKFGLPPESAAVGVAINSGIKHGLYEVRRAGPGVAKTNPKKITAIRLTATGTQRSRPRPTRPPVVVEPHTDRPAPAPEPLTEAEVEAQLPTTPLLREYMKARAFARMAPEANQYLTVAFEPIPMAEEAIALRKALVVEVLRRGRDA